MGLCSVLTTKVEFLFQHKICALGILEYNLHNYFSENIKRYINVFYLYTHKKFMGVRR